MPVLLACTVGGAPEPIVASIKAHNPSRVLFLCSPETRRMISSEPGVTKSESRCKVCGEPTHQCFERAGILERLKQEGVELDPGRYEILEVDDAQNLEACIRTFQRKLLSRLQQWLEQGEDFEVVVDFTGGTKCMSVALGLVTKTMPVSFSYVGGTERTKDGVGIVVSGREHIVKSQNPWDLLGYQVAEQALTLFNNLDYAAAAHLLKSGERRSKDPRLRQAFVTFQGLCELFKFWDRFQHEQALQRLRQVQRTLDSLRQFLTEGQLEQLEKQLPRWEAHLVVLARAELSKELIQDLLGNARRRIEEARWDDAMARIYRSIEAIAQHQLKTNYGLDTACIPLASLPESARQVFARKADANGTLKLALQDTYRLLELLGDPLGEKFRRKKLFSEPEHPSPLDVRNQSILAHGFQPITETIVKKLFQDALELAGVNEEELIEFPRL